MADSGSESATTSSGPIVCQGFLVKHGGFLKKKVQKRFFILRGNILEWEKRKTSTDNHKKKGSLAIKGDTIIETIDAGSNLFEFQVSNFRRITCGHNPDKPYRLGTTSGEERDMWLHCLQQATVLISMVAEEAPSPGSPESTLSPSRSSVSVSNPDTPLFSRGSVELSKRVSAPIITVQSIRDITEEALGGVFTSTLQVMFEVDAQPAAECISLDASIVNLLGCFAKCYGKGDIQSRRGIIQFAASKETRFRTFVTLRFSSASRSLSYASKPLSLCSETNFWADTSPNLQLLEKESNAIRQSLSARLTFASSVDAVSALPPFPIPIDVSSSVFASSDCSNTQNCRQFLSNHVKKARDVVQTVLSSVEGSDTSKLLAELEDIIRSQRTALEEIASANDELNAAWSQHVERSTGKLTGFPFASNYADNVIKTARPLLQFINKRVAWAQSIPQLVQTLHDLQFSRIFLEFVQTNHPNSKESFKDFYTLLREVDVLISDKINPNGAVLLEVRQWCTDQVAELWRVYVRDSNLSLQDSSPDQFVGILEPNQMFWKRQKAIPVLSDNAWASMNLKDDVGLEQCEDRPNAFKEFLLNKQTGLSFVMKEIDTKLDAFERAVKQKMKLAPEGFLGEVLIRILAEKSVIKNAIKVLASAEEEVDFHQKFTAKTFKLVEETKLATKKAIVKFQKHFSLESSQRISACFDALKWIFKHSPLLSESFLYFLQEKGAGVTHSSADSCHMLLLDIDLSFAIACIPNFQAFIRLQQSVCSCFLEDYTVFMKDSPIDPPSITNDSQFLRRYLAQYFAKIACALPDFPFKYSERCVQTLSEPLTEVKMDKAFFENQIHEFKEDVTISVPRITLMLKRYPVKDSELKFLKLLQNLSNLNDLCQNKLKAYTNKLERYGSAYVEFNSELVSCTQDLQARIDSRENGLTKPEKVLEKGDEYFQTMTKLFSKLCKAGNNIRKVPSLLEFCAEFVNFSMSGSPSGVLSALLSLSRAEAFLAANILPKLDAVDPFLSTVKEAGYVLKIGSEWFYPSHCRSLQLNGWSEKPDSEMPFMTSPFFSEAEPYIQKGDTQKDRETLIFIISETAKRFSMELKNLGLASTDVLANKLRQSVNGIGQNIKDFSAANSQFDKVCGDILVNSSREFTAAVSTPLFDKSSNSVKKHISEVHDALQAVHQCFSALQDIQLSRTFLRVTKDPSKEFWKQLSTNTESVANFQKLRDLFNTFHAFDVKVSEVLNPDGCNYLDSMVWFSHKLRTLEDWTSFLSEEQIDSLRTYHASESSSVQYWMCEYAIQTLDSKVFDEKEWTPDKEQLSARLSAPRASNEAFEAFCADGKKGISELMAVAESCLKDTNQFFETHFSNYVSLKSAKSKDVPKSGPSFDEFNSVSEVVQALESNVKRFKPAVETLLDNCSKLSNILGAFEKKTDASVTKIQEALAALLSRSETKFNDAFKKYCASIDTSSIHNGRLQLSQIFVDWWRVAGRSDALPVANSCLRVLRCFDNDIIAFFRPATKPLLDVRRHLISLRCRSECDVSAVEENVLNMSEILPVNKFIWPTQVSTRPSALVTYDYSQLMESRFSDVRVASFLRELRFRMTNIKAALENARVFYKDVKDEKSQAFGFSKIKSAIPSFEAYLEDELSEYIKAYALLDEQAQNLISTKPSLSSVRKNPLVLSNYLTGISKWQRDASSLSVTGGSFIRKLPVRNCMMQLQQKLRSAVLRQLYSFHDVRKNNISLPITSTAWNFRCFSERFRAMLLFDKLGPTLGIPTPEASASAQEIYSSLKNTALSKIAQATPNRQKLFKQLVGIIPSAVVEAEEFNKRTFLQEAIFKVARDKVSEDLLSALVSTCEPWDALVQGFCTLHPFADAINHCTSIDITVSLHDDDEDESKDADAHGETVDVTLALGDLSFTFPEVATKSRMNSSEGTMPFVKGQAATAANVLSEKQFSEKAMKTCIKKIEKATNQVKEDIRSTPKIDRLLRELLKTVNKITSDTVQQLRNFSIKIQSLIGPVSGELESVKQEVAGKLDVIKQIAKRDQLWQIHHSDFRNVQAVIRRANLSLMRELPFDYEPLQSWISIYNDQFLCSPQNQINVSFDSSDDILAMIHTVASSTWFTSMDTSGDKEGLSFYFVQYLKLKYKDMEKSVKRLEAVNRRIKESANDYLKNPKKKTLLNKLRARVFKTVLVETSLKLASAPFGYTFCKLMHEKGAWDRAQIDDVFKSNLRDVLQRFINLDFQLTFLIRADFSNPMKILSQLPSSPEALEAQSLVAFSSAPPSVPGLGDADAILDEKGDLDKFYGGVFQGQQPLSCFSIKSSLHAFLVSWHSVFRPGKIPSKDQLEFKAPVVIKRMLSSNEKLISFKIDEKNVYIVLGDPAGKSAEQAIHLNEIIICQAAPQSSAPNRLVLLEHNNDTVLSFASSEAAAVAMDAILQNQLLALSLCEENPASPRWRQIYAVKSFSLQFEHDFLFARLAARKFLEKYYPGESTFVDISDYASRINVEEEEDEDENEDDFSMPKVEKVPGGCLHFAISLEPEVHPLAEDRVATIALLGALDLPVPDSLKDKLSGSIQNVYFVIERGFSRTVSKSQVDCEGCPEFEENVSPQVFQGSQAALVEFDQENSIVTVKLHRKAPPKSKAMQYQPQEKAEEEEKEDEDAEEEEEEDLDDMNDELIAFCEFNLWDLVDIERGNHQVDLVERITQTFDCLTPDDAMRVLNNECHPSMVNFYGRSLIELGEHQDAIKEGVTEIKEGGFMNFFMGKAKGALQDKADELKAKAQGFVEDKLQGVADAAMQYICPQDDDEEDGNEDPVDDEDDDEALELTNRIFLAKQQLQRSIQNLELVAGGQSKESCGNIVKLDFLKQTRATNFQYFEFWLQSSPSRPLVEKQLLQSHYSEEDVKKICGEAAAQYMIALKSCHEIFGSEMMHSLRPVVLSCLNSVRDKAIDFGDRSREHYELTADKHEELEKLCGEFDLNPKSFSSLSAMFGFWWRGAAPRYSHLSLITREDANRQLLKYRISGTKNPKSKAELQEKMRKCEEKLANLKSEVPFKCREFCSVMLSVFGDAYAFDCAISDAIHTDSRRANQLNEVLQNLNSDLRVAIPSRPSPPSLSFEAFVNCFGGLDTVSIGLEPRSIAVLSQPLAAVSRHVISSLSQLEGQGSVSRHLLRIADQVASRDWAEWLAHTSSDPQAVNKTSEAYMLNYAHMSGNLRAKAYSVFMQWSAVYKRLLPGKGYVEVPEFARMRPGDSLDDFDNSDLNMWNSGMVQAVKEMLSIMQKFSHSATFTRPFIDVCTGVYRLMHMFCSFLKNSSVIYEGVLNCRDFWIACVGSSEASIWISNMRANKLLIKECINAAFFRDSAAVISSISCLFANAKPQPETNQKDVWICAFLGIVLENCVQAGDLIGAASCCCSMADIASAHQESADKLTYQVMSLLAIDDEDGTNRIPFIVDALFEVSQVMSSKGARSSAAAAPSSHVRDVCYQAAQVCDSIFAPLLQGTDDVDSEISKCSEKLLQAAGCAEVANMPAVAENWAKSNRVQIFETFSATLPQLNNYSWSNEAFSQAWTGLKLLSLLCSAEDSVVRSVVWVSVQLFTAVNHASFADVCPEFHKIFMRCSSGSRNFSFKTIGSGIIPVPDSIRSSSASFRELCQTFVSDCSAIERAQGILKFTSSVVANPSLTTVLSSFLHLRSVRKLLAGSFGSVSKFFHDVGHFSVMRLSMLFEKKDFLGAAYLLKHLQSCCLNSSGSDDADVALIVDSVIVGLATQGIKSLPSISSPSGASFLFAVCSCSSVNRSLPCKDLSKILHCAVSMQGVSKEDMELAVCTLCALFECCGKSFTVDVEAYSASFSRFLDCCYEFLLPQGSAFQWLTPLVQQLAALIGPVLKQNPKLLGSVSMLEANKLLKSQIKLISIELSNATYNWSSIATCLLNVLKTILAASPSIAAHCCLALSASISFSLKLKQLLRQNSSDISSLKLLVANLFTIGCSGDGDTDDILHSVCNAVLTRRDIDLMDSLCAQTRADLKADPNALEFFNTFSSKENIQKLLDLQQKISEGYEPGGHRVTALRASLLTAGQLLSTACSSLFFTHTSRTNIVLVCCKSFEVWGLEVEQVKVLSILGPTLDALFTAISTKNYSNVVKVCEKTISLITQHRIKDPRTINRDYFWIICSLLLAIKVFSGFVVSIKTNGLASERLLRCIPLLMRTGLLSELVLAILCEDILSAPEVLPAIKSTMRGAWGLLRASRSMKEQSIVATAKNFGQFFSVMEGDAKCFEVADAQQSVPKGAKKKGKKEATKKNPQRSALLKMFSPGLNRKIAEGLLDNLASCAAFSDALEQDSTTTIINRSCVSGEGGGLCIIEAASCHLSADADLREAKRMITSDFSDFNFVVKKAVDVKFKVNKSSISSAVMDKVKDAFESCQQDDDEAESEESQSVMSQVIDAFTPTALKQILPAVTTVVGICSKDIPAILRKLTNEYFLNRETKFQILASEDACLDNGIPFNPAQLAEPGTYVELTKSISNPLQIKYIKIMMEKAEKEIGAYLIVLFFFKMHTAQYIARTLHFARGVITLLKGPIVKDIIASTPVQAVLKAPPLSVLPPSAYESMIMAAVKAAFAATVIFRVRSIVEMEVHYSHLLLYAKIVPAKERLQVVARSYFNSIGALLQPAILVHTAVFSACAKAVFLSVNLSASLSDDTNSDWLKLKEQLCTCGDANVAVFLSNRRRSNAVMHLSLATLALLRPLRTAFDSSTLVSAAECLNGHSQAVKLKLDNDFEDWDFFADDFDKRLECIFQQGQSSGLKQFIAACMREAGVMVLTRVDVAESDQSLFMAFPQKRSSTILQRNSMPMIANAASPFKARAPSMSISSPVAQLELSSPTSSSHSSPPSAPQLTELQQYILAQEKLEAEEKLAREKLEKQKMLTNLSSMAFTGTPEKSADPPRQPDNPAMQAKEHDIQEMQRECKVLLSKHALQPRLPAAKRAESKSSLLQHIGHLDSCLRDIKSGAVVNSTKVREVNELVAAVSAVVDQHQDFENRVKSSLDEMELIQAKISVNKLPLEEAAAFNVRYRASLSQEESMTLSTIASSSESPEVREAMTAFFESYRKMELQADSAAVAFVQDGSTLLKYAREKVLKKSRHDPVSSTVKITPALTLLWGSHKTGPQILELLAGPSQALVDSGLLGAQPNANVHLHVNVADGSSKTGREIIDFVGPSEADVSKWIRAYKYLSKK